MKNPLTSGHFKTGRKTRLSYIINMILADDLVAHNAYRASYFSEIFESQYHEYQISKILSFNMYTDVI